VVTVQLNPNQAVGIEPGSAVTIDLPDGRTRTPGVVSAVSTVAQVTSNQGQTQSGSPQVSVPATVTLSDPSQAPTLDQAPVTVEITIQSAKNVLAVPVNALLALEGGGYAVEVPDAGGRGTRLVAVQTGIFDNSRVEVSGGGLSEGMSVVVPE
jgi:multidrug efflux pump subunit AcrA (membrane-fusion protein)